MSEQELKVGVVFEFKGIDDLEGIGQAVEKAMKTAMGNLGIKGGIIEIRMADLDAFKVAIASFHAAVQELAATLKNAKVAIAPADKQQKGNGGTKSGAIRNQTKAQIDIEVDLDDSDMEDFKLTVQEAIQLTSRMITPLTATERKLLDIKGVLSQISVEGTGPFFRDVIETSTLIRGLGSSLDDFSSKYRHSLGAIGSMLKASLDQVDNNFDNFGQRAVGGISIIDKAMSSMSRGSLNQLSRMLVAVSTEVNSKLSEIEATSAKIEADDSLDPFNKMLDLKYLEGEKKQLEKRRENLTEFAMQVDRYDKVISQQEEQGKRRSKIERDFANITNRSEKQLKSDFMSDIGSIIGEGDAAKIRSLTDNYEGLGRSMTNNIIASEKLGESTRASAQEAQKSLGPLRKELEAVEASLKGASGSEAGAFAAQAAILKSLIASSEEHVSSLSKINQRVQENIVLMKQRKIEANQVLGILRSERRESEELQRVNENAFREATKARRAMQNALSNDIVTGQRILDPNNETDIKAAKKALANLDREILNVTKNSKAMQLATVSKMAEVYERVASRRAEFSEFGPDGTLTLEQMDKMNTLIDDQISGLSKKLAREEETNAVLLEAGRIARETSGVQIEAFLEQAKAAEKVNDALDKQVNLGIRLSRARSDSQKGLNQVSSGNPVKIEQGEATLKASASAYRSVGNEIESILILLAQFEAAGGKLSARQIKTRDQLVQWQQESKNVTIGINNIVAAISRQIDTMDKLRSRVAAVLENDVLKVGAAGLGLDYKDEQSIKGVKDAISSARSELARLANQKVEVDISFKSDIVKLQDELNQKAGVFAGKTQKAAASLFNKLMRQRADAHKLAVSEIEAAEVKLTNTLKNTAAAASNEEFLKLADAYRGIVQRLDSGKLTLDKFASAIEMTSSGLRRLKSISPTEKDLGLDVMSKGATEANKISGALRNAAFEIYSLSQAGVTLSKEQQDLYNEFVNGSKAALAFSSSVQRTVQTIKSTISAVDKLVDSTEIISRSRFFTGGQFDLKLDVDLSLAQQAIKRFDSELAKLDNTKISIQLDLDDEMARLNSEAQNQTGRFSGFRKDGQVDPSRGAEVSKERLKYEIQINQIFADQVNTIDRQRTMLENLNMTEVAGLRTNILEEESRRKVNQLLEDGIKLTSRFAAIQAKGGAGFTSIMTGDGAEKQLGAKVMAEASSEANSLSKKIEDLAIKTIEAAQAQGGLTQSQRDQLEILNQLGEGFRRYGTSISSTLDTFKQLEADIRKTQSAVKLLQENRFFSNNPTYNLMLDVDYSQAKQALSDLDKQIKTVREIKIKSKFNFTEEREKLTEEANSQTGRFDKFRKNGQIDPSRASEVAKQALTDLDLIIKNYTERNNELKKEEQTLIRLKTIQAQRLEADMKVRDNQVNLNKEVEKLDDIYKRAGSSFDKINQAIQLMQSSDKSDQSMAARMFGNVASESSSAGKAILSAQLAIDRFQASGAVLDATQQDIVARLKEMISVFAGVETSSKRFEETFNKMNRAARDAEVAFRMVAANPIFKGTKVLDINVKADRDAGKKALKDLDKMLSDIDNKDIMVDIEFNFKKDELARMRQKFEGPFAQFRDQKGNVSLADTFAADSKAANLVTGLSTGYKQVKQEIEATRQEALKLKQAQEGGLINFVDDIAKIEKVESIMDRVAATMVKIKQNEARVVGADQLMGSANNLDRIAGVQQIQKAGSEARSLADEIMKLDFEIRDLTASNIKLTSSQQMKVDAMLKERNALMQLDAQVRKRNELLERQRRLEQELGQSLSLYNNRMADSIRHQFAYINALTVVTSVIFGVRMAFMELLSESRAFARTLVVMQSNTNDFITVYNNMKTVVRDTAVEFGRSVDEVAEIVKQFGSAGFSAEKSMSALRSTTQLVISTNVSAEAAARSVAGIYKVFSAELQSVGSDMAQFARINDVLLGVYRNHQVELDELIQGFRFAGSASKLAGFSLSDTSAMLAVLNDNMIKSGTAGRGLQVVLAQVASKSDQFEKAFGVAINRGAPLTEQFIELLSQVNTQMASGVMTVDDLDKRFKIFGLRGARSFAVLAEQFPKVIEAMRRLDKESKGLGDRLSQIVKSELATQFDGAKQALIDIAREFIDPAKEVLIIVANLVKGFRDFFNSLGPIADLIKSFIFWGAILSTFLMTLFAVMTVIATMGVQFITVTGIIKKHTFAVIESTLAKAHLTAVTAANSAALSGNAAAVTAATARVKVAAAAQTALGAAAAVSSLKLLVIAAAATVVIGAFIYFRTTVRSLQSDLDGMASSLSEVERGMSELDRFSTTLDNIQSSTLSPEAKANSLLQVLSNTNKELIRGSAINNQSRADIAKNINQNILALKQEATARAKVLELQKQQQTAEIKITQLNLLDKQVTDFDWMGVVETRINKIKSSDFKDVAGNFRELGAGLEIWFDVINSNIGEGGLGSVVYVNDIIDEYESAISEIDKLQGHLLNLNEMRRQGPPPGIRESTYNYQLDKEVEKIQSDIDALGGVEKKAQQEVDRIVSFIVLAAEKVTVEGESVTENAFKTLDQLFLGRFSDSAMARIRAKLDQTFFVPMQFVVPPSASVDIQKLLFGSLEEITLAVDAPFDASLFKGVVDELLAINSEFEVIDANIRSFQGMLFEIDSAFNAGSSGIDKYKRSMNMLDNIGVQYKNLEENAKDLGYVTKETISDIVDDMGNMDRIPISQESLTKFMERLVGFQTLTEEAKVSLTSMFQTNIETPQDLVKAMMDVASSSEFIDGASVSVKNLGKAYLMVREALRTYGAEMNSVFSNNVAFMSQLIDILIEEKLPRIVAQYTRLVDGIRKAIFTTADLNPLEQMINRRQALMQQLVAQNMATSKDLSALVGSTVEGLARLDMKDMTDGMAGSFITQKLLDLKNMTDAVETAADKVDAATANVNEASGKGEREEEEKKLQFAIEVFKKKADILKISKDILKLQVEEVNNQRKLNQQINEAVRLGKSGQSSARVKARQLNEEIAGFIRLVQVQELGRRNQAIQQFYLSQYLEHIPKIIEAQEALVDQLVEENVQRYEALAIIEQTLDKDRASAGIREEMIGKVIKLNQLNKQAIAIDKQRNEGEFISGDLAAAAEGIMIEKVKLLSDIIGLEDKIKKSNQDKNKILDDQFKVYQDIAGILGDEASRSEATLRESISKWMDNIGNAEEAARQLARAAGVSVNEAIFNQADVIDSLIETIKRDGVSTLSAFNKEFQALGNYITDLSKRQEDYRLKSEKLAQQQASLELSNVYEGLAKGTETSLKSAGESLERYLSLVDAAFAGGDAENPNFERMIKGREKYLELLEKLNSAQTNLDPTIDVKMMIDGVPLQQWIDVSKVALSALGKNLQLELDKITAGDFGAVLTGDYIVEFAANKEAKQAFNLAVDGLVNSLNNLAGEIGYTNIYLKDMEPGFGGKLSLFGEPLKRATGGSIPGFGGGDIVPAMLEPGEYVIPKNIVRKMGVGFFEQLRRGNLPGFQTGGLVDSEDLVKSRMNSIIRNFQYMNDFAEAYLPKASSLGNFNTLKDLSRGINYLVDSIEASPDGTIGTDFVRELQMMSKAVSDILSRPGTGSTARDQSILRSIERQLMYLVDWSEHAPDHSTAVGYANGGSLPGYGGGDIIPAMLEPGEYVIPKNIVRKMGVGFFEQLRSGRIPGFTLGGSAGGVSPRSAQSIFFPVKAMVNPIVNALDNLIGEVKEGQAGNETIVSSIRDGISKVEELLVANWVSQVNANAVDQMNQFIAAVEQIAPKLMDSLGKMGQSVVSAFTKSVSGNSKDGKDSRDEAKKKSEQKTMSKEIEETLKRLSDTYQVLDTILSGFISTISGAFGNIVNSVSGILVPEFAKENAQLRADFIETIREINKSYQSSTDTAVTQLKRNESSYYAYLNAIQDAERQRQQEILNAQEEYRESLKKTEEVMGGMINSLNSSILGGLASFGDGIAEAALGGMKDQVKGLMAMPFLKLGDSLADTFSGKENEDGSRSGGLATSAIDAAKSAWGAITEDLPDRINETATASKSAGEIFEESINTIGSGIFEFGKVAGSVAAGIAGAGLGLVATGIESLIGLTTGDDNGKDIVEWVEKFMSELADNIPRFIDSLIENSTRLIEAIAEAMPEVIEVLVEEAPRFLEALVESLETALPKITKALADGLPILIKRIVPVIMRLIILLIDQLPEILGSIAESIPILIMEVIKKLPELAVSLVKAVVLGVLKIIGGFFKGIFGGIFHKGGIVNTPTEEALILARKGEGILTPEAVRQLGGASAIQALNAGIDPRQLAPNVIDPTGLAKNMKVERIVPSSSSSSSVVNNNFSMSVPISGNESNRELRAKADTLIEMVDDGLTKLAKDRKSKFARL